MTLDATVVSDIDEFASMREEWTELLAKAPNRCVFLNWEWHFIWWKTYATKLDKLLLLRLSSQGKTVGILPVYFTPNRFSFYGCVRFLGTGEAQEDEVATEYLDVIAAEGFENEVADAAAQWLVSIPRVSCVELHCMLEDAHIVQACWRQHNGIHFHCTHSGTRYQVVLNGTEEEHLQRMPSSRRKRIARSKKSVLKDGGLTQLSVSTERELNQAFRELVELNHERQEKKERKSVFASSKFLQFHRELCLALLPLQAVNIQRFKLGTRLLAVLYCFYDDRTCYYYQSGFAERAANRYMPLTIAHLTEIQRNREAGLVHYDLMRGKPPTYKEDFACETTSMCCLYLFPSAWRLHFFLAKLELRRRLVSFLCAIGIKRVLLSLLNTLGVKR